MKKIVNKRPYLENTENFTNRYAEYALKTEKKYGLPAIAMLAQLALETGWGKKILALYTKESPDVKVDSKNLFNIKINRKWKGKIGHLNVWEDYDKDGKRDADEYEEAYFRIYDSYQQAFDDYAKLITKTKRYKSAVKVANDPVKYVEELQRCGYATDGRYAVKMKNIMKKNWEVVIEEEPSKIKKLMRKLPWSRS